MPRIRSIKPEFFASEDVAELPFRARLTWVGLWTHCDDHGRSKDQVKLIKAAVWPLDDVGLGDVEDDLELLADKGRIVRYEVDGIRYLAVRNWHVHQSINKPGRPKCPQPPVDNFFVPPPGEPGHCKMCFDQQVEGVSRSTTGTLPDNSRNGHGTLPGGTGNREQGTGRGTREPRNAPGIGSPRCQKHKNTPPGETIPNCIECRDLRIAAENAKAAIDDSRRQEAETRRTAITNCERCDELGWAIDPDGYPIEPATKCQHNTKATRK